MPNNKKILFLDKTGLHNFIMDKDLLTIVSFSENKYLSKNMTPEKNWKAQGRQMNLQDYFKMQKVFINSK